MTPIHIDASHFSPDTRAFLESLAAEQGEVPLSFIGLDALVRNRRATARPRDLDDLAYLTRGE